MQEKRAETEAIKRKGAICLYWHTSGGEGSEGDRRKGGRQSATREGGGKRGVSRMSGFQVNTCVRGSFVVCIRFVCLQSLHCVLASRKLRGFAGLASRRGTGESGRVESN